MQIDESGYNSRFPRRLRAKALSQALDIRKFEIELYWKRATYFWTLIGVSFAGLGLTYGEEASGIFPTAISCIDFVFSLGWSLVIKGSKQWQENWENHVEMLENAVHGPLYKTVLRRPKPEGFRAVSKQILTGPAPFSVSSINQIISYFVCFVWLIFLCGTLEIGQPYFSWSKALLVALSVAACALFFVVGRTHLESHSNRADTRRVTIDSSERT
jgi:hypothetical protein